MVTRTGPRAQPVPYLPQTPPAGFGPCQNTASASALAAHGCTSIHFGENQLSPGSIGISPLPTGHPPVLQHRWVRASTGSYPRFTLPMGSSPGFGSHASDAPHAGLRALFRRRRPFHLLLAFAWAPPLLRRGLTRGDHPGAVPSAAAMNSPDHSTKGTPSPPRGGVTEVTPSLWRLRLLVGSGFQALFHPPCGVLFTFPSRYSCTIGGRLYLRLGGWSPLLPTGFRVSRGTQGAWCPQLRCASWPTGLSPSVVGLPRPFG